MGGVHNHMKTSTQVVYVRWVHVGGVHNHMLATAYIQSEVLHTGGCIVYVMWVGWGVIHGETTRGS